MVVRSGLGSSGGAVSVIRFMQVERVSRGSALHRGRQ